MKYKFRVVWYDQAIHLGDIEVDFVGYAINGRSMRAATITADSRDEAIDFISSRASFPLSISQAWAL